MSRFTTSISDEEEALIRANRIADFATAGRLFQEMKETRVAEDRKLLPPALYFDWCKPEAAWSERRLHHSLEAMYGSHFKWDGPKLFYCHDDCPSDNRIWHEVVGVTNGPPWEVHLVHGGTITLA